MGAAVGAAVGVAAMEAVVAAVLAAVASLPAKATFLGEEREEDNTEGVVRRVGRGVQRH